MIKETKKFRFGFKFLGFEFQYEKRIESRKKEQKRKTGNRSKKSR